MSARWTEKEMQNYLARQQRDLDTLEEEMLTRQEQRATMPAAKAGTEGIQSMTSITLHLSWPPSLNHYWRHVGPKILISKAGRQYQKRVAEEVMVQWPAGLRQTLYGRLRVWVDVFPPDRRLRDLDNLSKSLLDALQHACIYANDGQIDDLRLLRHTSNGKPGYVSVMVEEIRLFA